MQNAVRMPLILLLPGKRPVQTSQMEGVGIILIFALVVIAVFACGFWIGARSFGTTFSKIVAGILCGLGAIVIVSGIAFAGCMFLLRKGGLH